MVSLPTRPSVPPVSKPASGEARLHLLYFGQGQRTLRAGERLDEGRCALDAITEMDDRERIVHRRVVAPHRKEIWSEQERRSAGFGDPELRRCVRLREWLAVGAHHASARPCRISPAALGRSLGTHFIAPMFAGTILAAIDQIFGGRAERVVGPAEGRDFSVAVIVDADMEPDLGHPLGMAHRAGPGAAHLWRRTPALVDNVQRIDELAFPIGFSARRIPGERGKRGEDRAHMILLHLGIAEGALDAPEREQRAALDAEVLFDAREQRFVLFQRELAVNDAPVGDAAIDVLPGGLGELRLGLHFPEDAHVGLDPRHGVVPGRFRNALGHRPVTEMLAPFVEPGRCGRRSRRLG